MKTLHHLIITIAFFLLFSLQISSAQDTAKSHLPEGAKLRIGKGTLGEIAYFPDGTRFAVATSIGVCVYDSLNGNVLYQLKDPAKSVYGINSVSFTPDGETIVTEGPNADILLWNANLGSLKQTFTDSEMRLYSPVFLPDGKLIAVQCSEKHSYETKTLRIYDVQTAEHLYILTIPTNRFDIRFSFNKKVLATWSNFTDSVGEVSLWDIKTGKEIKTIYAHEHSITSVCFSPDGKTLLTSGLDKTARLWDVDTGEHLNSLTHENSDDFSSIRFSSDGETIVTTDSSDGSVRIWAVNTGQYLKSFFGLTEGKASCVCFSPNGKIIAASGTDGTILLWSTNTAQQLIRLIGHEGQVNTVSFSPDSMTILSKGTDNTVRLWNAITGQLIITLNGYTNSVNALAYSPDGKIFVSGSSLNNVSLWDANSGHLLKALKGHAAAIKSVCFSPDGKTIATGSSDKTIRLWNVSTGEHIKTITGLDRSINSVSFSLDGQTLVGYSRYSKVYFWNVNTGQQIKTLNGDLVSPDGKTLILVEHFTAEDGCVEGGDSFLYLSDIDTEEFLSKITYSGNLSVECFSQNGKWFATFDEYNSTVEIWDVTSGHVINSLRGHVSLPYYGVGNIVVVRFSPNGKTIATASSVDATVIIWNPNSGERLKTLTGHTGGISSIAFSPDGKTLASGSMDGTILLWEVP